MNPSFEGEERRGKKKKILSHERGLGLRDVYYLPLFSGERKNRGHPIPFCGGKRRKRRKKASLILGGN